MRRLLRDRFIALSVGLVAVPLFVYVWPPARAGGFPTWWAGGVADPCFLLLAIWTLLASPRPVTHPEERRFWWLILTTCVLWLGGNVAAFAQPQSGAQSPARLVRDVLYLLSYVALILAADFRPHLPAGWSRAPRTMLFAASSSLLCVGGIILCFFVLPVLQRPDSAWGEPALVTFQALNVLLIIRFVHLWHRASGTSWAGVYGWLAFSMAFAAVGDAMNALIRAQRLLLTYGTPFDAIWWLPMIGIIVARRLRSRHREPSAGTAAIVLEEPRTDGIELLYLYAMGFPVMDFALRALGIHTADAPATHMAIVGVLLAFVTLAVAQQRLLERHNRDLRSQLRVLVTSEQVVQSQKLEAIGRMAGGLAHDFNNLLTVVLGRTELLLISRDSSQGRGDLEEIERAAQRGAQLTRQLLAFSRHQVMSTRVLDLNAVVSEAESMLVRIVGEPYAIDTECTPDLPLIEAEPSQIFQVLLNLATNARDAMPEGGRIAIRTYATTLGPGTPDVVPPTPGGNFVAVDVGDTGTGIGDDARRHLFDPFFTLKVGGTGLGLAVVYGIVAQSHGHIRVRSTPGLGTTFTVMFPQSTRSNAHEAPAAEPLRAPELPRRTVLLVEDQPEVRALTHGMLLASGFDVLEASGGPEALAVYRAMKPPPDILLTDVAMPGMRGPELAAVIRAEQPGVLVVFMSGYSESAADTLADAAPHSRFLSKPFTLAALRSVLDGAPASADQPDDRVSPPES